MTYIVPNNCIISNDLCESMNFSQAPANLLARHLSRRKYIYFTTIIATARLVKQFA